MNRERLKEKLKAFKQGSLSEEQLVESLIDLPYEDIGFAKVDHHRSLRQGFPEVIFGRGKSNHQILKIAESILGKHPNLLITAGNETVYSQLSERFEGCEFSPNCGAITVCREPFSKGRGKITVLSAGTADIPVAEEAEVTARALGNDVVTSYDVGVAGIHRVLRIRKDLRNSTVVIVVAGMEGALPSVVGGLIDVPVIAVPTSIGYGASFGGIAALLGMLNSCSANVTVVNIDNGFGAGYVASLINRER